jgi:hypothetical protein
MTARTVDTCHGCGRPTAFLTAEHDCMRNQPTNANLEYTVKAQRLLMQHNGDVAATAETFLRSTLPKDYERLLETILPVWITAATIPPSKSSNPTPIAPRTTHTPAPPTRSKKWATVSRGILDRHVIVRGERISIGELTADDCRWLAQSHTTQAETHRSQAHKWEALADVLELAGVEHVSDIDVDRVKEVLR